MTSHLASCGAGYCCHFRCHCHDPGPEEAAGSSCQPEPPCCQLGPLCCQRDAPCRSQDFAWWCSCSRVVMAGAGPADRTLDCSATSFLCMISRQLEAPCCPQESAWLTAQKLVKHSNVNYSVTLSPRGIERCQPWSSSAGAANHIMHDYVHTADGV